MSAKFASITADLLARKGAAMPSAIAAKALLDWSVPAQHLPQPKPSRGPAARGDALPLHRDDAHYMRKIQIGLSDHDHERLRILSARKETSRQQVVRDALAAYFEQQAHAYNDECRCLAAAGSCSNGCAAR